MSLSDNLFANRADAEGSQEVAQFLAELGRRLRLPLLVTHEAIERGGSGMAPITINPTPIQTMKRPKAHEPWRRSGLLVISRLPRFDILVARELRTSVIRRRRAG